MFSGQLFGALDRTRSSDLDQVLQRMARFLMREVRSDEPVIRLGGDEFLIVLAGENSSRTPAISIETTPGASSPTPTWC